MKAAKQSTLVKLDPNRSFDNVEQALDYCRGFGDNSMEALRKIVVANLDMGEYGFASKLCKEAELL